MEPNRVEELSSCYRRSLNRLFPMEECYSVGHRNGVGTDGKGEFIRELIQDRKLFCIRKGSIREIGA